MRRTQFGRSGAGPGTSPALAFALLAPAIGVAAWLASGCAPQAVLDSALSQPQVSGAASQPAAVNAAPLPAADNFHAIVAGQAYRSAQLDAATLKRVIETYGIRTVINLRGPNPGVAWYDAEQATTADLSVTLDDVTMSAHALPARTELLKLYDDFQSADYPILMHCQGGADRAGAAAAIWRMEINGDPRDVAAQELSPAYGHFKAFAPEMDQLVAMFQPDRNWILNDYTGPDTAATATGE